jgi:hypothetical protein
LSSEAALGSPEVEKDSYSRAEVVSAGHAKPGRGPVCHECGNHIPIFEDLSEADERRIRECISENGRMMAMRELQLATGCSLIWAKLWAEHEGAPKPAKDPSPCPYCGMPLRTSLSKQCRFCLKDWHDESNVILLGSR